MPPTSDLPQQPRGRWTAAIALAALLLGIGAATAMLAARRGGTDASVPVSASDTLVPLTAPDLAGTIVEFPVEGTRLEVRVDAAQDAGTLRIDRADSALASIQSVGGQRHARILVRPGLVQVRNQPGSRASYFLRIPRHVTRIVVYVAGHATHLDSDALPSTLMLR